MIDLYTKTVLTVIAAALVGIVAQQANRERQLSLQAPAAKRLIPAPFS